MERLEFLNKLEEKVKSEGSYQYYYKQKIDEKECYCILGHAYNIVGKEEIINTELYEDSTTYSALNETEFILENDTGLTRKELIQLQGINDDYYNYNDRKRHLLGFIQELKKLKESQ